MADKSDFLGIPTYTPSVVLSAGGMANQSFDIATIAAASTTAISSNGCGMADQSVSLGCPSNDPIDDGDMVADQSAAAAAVTAMNVSRNGCV